MVIGSIDSGDDEGRGCSCIALPIMLMLAGGAKAIARSHHPGQTTRIGLQRLLKRDFVGCWVWLSIVHPAWLHAHAAPAR